jgi:hypothetical protein
LVRGCRGETAPAPLFVRKYINKGDGKNNMTIEKKAEGWIDDLVGALCDPIIVYPSPRKDDLPDWVKPQITLERLVMNMKVVHEGGVPVGDTEALAYIFPRTMEEPLS